MGIREALWSRLTGFTGVQDLINGRLYPNSLPQGAALPAIAYQRISKPTLTSHTDTPGSEQLVRPRIQLTCWAATADAVEALGDQVLKALTAYRGTIGGVRIDAVIPQNDLGGRDPGSGRHQRVIDIFVWHAE